MTHLKKLHNELHAFSLEIVSESVRNLDLLEKNEPTRSQLSRLSAQMTADAAFAGKSIAAILMLNTQVDLDGSIAEKLQQAQNNINLLCDKLGFMHKTGEEVGEPNENSNGFAFTEAIAASDKLHDILGILCSVVDQPIQSSKELVSRFYAI